MKNHDDFKNRCFVAQLDGFLLILIVHIGVQTAYDVASRGDEKLAI